MFIILGKTSFLNYKINKQIEGMRNRVDTLEQENIQIAKDIEYFKTVAYKEKVARQRLGLKKKDEEVLVVIPEEKGEKEQEKPDYPNYKKWWFFLNGKDI